MATRLTRAEYDPKADSSPNTEVYRVDPDAKSGDQEAPGFTGVILDYSDLPEPHSHLQPCACGCRQPVGNKNSQFRPGHDARLKGILIRAHVTGTEVTWLEDALANSNSAYGFAQRFTTPRQDWQQMLTDAQQRADRPIQPSRGVVKVGRWEYPARKHGDGRVEHNTMRDGSGDWTSTGPKAAASFRKP